MNIAAYNGLPYHYEMFGYILYFCYMNKHKLTIYCDTDKDMGYIPFYNELFKDYTAIYKPVERFNSDKDLFDVIILITAGDHTFNTDNAAINNKTFCIDHLTQIMSPSLHNRIGTRPFADMNERAWALPTYPILNSAQKNRAATTNIVILGYAPVKYNTQIINRLRDNNSITIHAISRNDTPAGRTFSLVKFRARTSPVQQNKFEGLAESFTLIRHYAIKMNELINIFRNADYILTDLTDNKDYTTGCMSGAIPISFGTLTPLIISKQTNAYYNFKNVIEFDKDSGDPIVLKPIDMGLLEKERDEHIARNDTLFTRLCSEISRV